jgi:hypothetical protein
MADEIFRVTKDANGNPVYTRNNQVLSKEEFDQKNAQSTAEMNAMKNQKDDFDSEFDDMRAKTIAMKKPVKKAKGGSISSASSRGDGCAIRGKTKGKFV